MICQKLIYFQERFGSFSILREEIQPGTEEIAESIRASAPGGQRATTATPVGS
jgi:hypothetical protein